MSDDTKVEPIAPGQSWEIDLFRPEDAEGVVRLFRQVYGSGYPVRTFIDPDLLREENAERRTISSVARTPSGDIVGHNALFRSAPYDRIYEGGAGLVDPTYRGGSIAFKLVEHGQNVAARKFGVEAIFGEAVCNHVFMQKVSVNLGWVTCAIEVDLMPAAAYSKEKSAEGRVSTLLEFLVLEPKEQTVYLPAPYEELLRSIYSGFPHECSLIPSRNEPLPAGVKTRIDTQIFDFAQVARFAVQEAGEDFARVLGREEAAARAKGVVVHQVWLKLSRPWVGEAVDLLRARGYFIGGALPRWFDEDGLLMQKVTDAPRWDGIRIFSDRAIRILEAIKADCADVSGGK